MFVPAEQAIAPVGPLHFITLTGRARSIEIIGLIHEALGWSIFLSRMFRQFFCSYDPATEGYR